jgi:MoaA/NifB/PqqE/SkfB family radical SAM enzyme
MFVEYVPVAPGAEAITMDERRALVNAAASFRKRFPAAFIAFPGEEEQFGGCLAAGRGFVHVNASGDLEPCPVAPYSDVNLRTTSFKAGLQSDLLSAIRNDHALLRDMSGGCALWANRERLMALQETA